MIELKELNVFKEIEDALVELDLLSNNDSSLFLDLDTKLISKDNYVSSVRLPSYESIKECIEKLADAFYYISNNADKDFNKIEAIELMFDYPISRIEYPFLNILSDFSELTGKFNLFNRMPSIDPFLFKKFKSYLDLKDQPSINDYYIFLLFNDTVLLGFDPEEYFSYLVFDLIQDLTTEKLSVLVLSDTVGSKILKESIKNYDVKESD